MRSITAIIIIFVMLNTAYAASKSAPKKSLSDSRQYKEAAEIVTTKFLELISNPNDLDDTIQDITWIHKNKIDKVLSYVTISDSLDKTDYDNIFVYRKTIKVKASNNEESIKVITTYYDKISNKWKVYGFNKDIDLAKELVAQSNKLNDNSFIKMQFNYRRYGHWQMLAGNIEPAKKAFIKAIELNLKDPDDKIDQSEFNINFEVLNDILGQSKSITSREIENLTSKQLFIPNAPFGLKWGINSDILLKSRVKLDLKEKIKNVSIYNASSLPKQMTDTDNMVLFFDSHYGLSKILWIGSNIPNDAYGTSGKDKYIRMMMSLTDKYGEPTERIEYIGENLYKNSDEFYECLNYSGCGAFISLWKTKDVNISFELKALNRSAGYLVITYEHDNWSKALLLINEQNKEAL